MRLRLGSMVPAPGQKQGQRVTRRMSHRQHQAQKLRKMYIRYCEQQQYLIRHNRFPKHVRRIEQEKQRLLLLIHELEG